jgi:hypothetical protein
LAYMGHKQIRDGLPYSDEGCSIRESRAYYCKHLQSKFYK